MTWAHEAIKETTKRKMRSEEFKEKKRAHSRRWNAIYREKFIIPIRERAFNMLGGKRCFVCHNDRLPHYCYDFHHIQNKSALVSKLINHNFRDWTNIEKEVRNCILLCASCHRLVTHLGLDGAKEYISKNI